MIRKASEADMPDLLRMGRAFHTASGQPFGFNEDATRAFLSGVMSGGAILRNDGGMIGGVLAPAYCDPDWVMAVELFWWAESGGIALLRAFEGWAQGAGANEVRMTSLASLDRADRLLKAKGYSVAEISYRKVI